MHGRREATDRARRAALSMRRLELAEAALRGRLCVWLTSDLSSEVAFAFFVDFAASACPPPASRTSRLAPDR